MTSSPSGSWAMKTEMKISSTEPPDWNYIITQNNVIQNKRILPDLDEDFEELEGDLEDLEDLDDFWLFCEEAAEDWRLPTERPPIRAITLPSDGSGAGWISSSGRIRGLFRRTILVTKARNLEVLISKTRCLFVRSLGVISTITLILIHISSFLLNCDCMEASRSKIYLLTENGLI
jgi:hypothetical protein